MRQPLHMTIAPNGDVQLRLSPDDVEVLAGHDTCKVKVFQDCFREALVVAEAEAALRGEAVR